MKFIRLEKLKMKIRDITLTALFSALVCIGAFIKIPIPALPITMQVFFVLLAGMLLGSKRGALSILVYMFLGLAGLPIFAAGGGLMYVLKPSFGYIIGFLFAAFAMGLICEKKFCLRSAIIACVVGLAIIYAFGMSYYYIMCRFVLGQAVSVSYVITYCFLTVIGGDIVSAIVAILISLRLKKISLFA